MKSVIMILGLHSFKDLNVYEAGTKYPPYNEDFLMPTASVPEDTTQENPLRVVIPGVVSLREGKILSFFHIPHLGQ